VEGLEPPTPGFGDRCSNQLSYTPRVLSAYRVTAVRSRPPESSPSPEDQLEPGLRRSDDWHQTGRRPAARQLHELRSGIHRPGTEDLADNRQPVRHEVVTHVSGMDPKKTGAGEGNRTLVFSLEGCGSTIELHPRRARNAANCAVGQAGRSECPEYASVPERGLRKRGTRSTATMPSIGRIRSRGSAALPSTPRGIRSGRTGGGLRTTKWRTTSTP
jgi:hypothetical protein